MGTPQTRSSLKGTVVPPSLEAHLTLEIPGFCDFNLKLRSSAIPVFPIIAYSLSRASSRFLSLRSYRNF